MYAKSVVAVALFAGLAAAQSNITIDPNSVDINTRASWCAGEINTCGTLCSGATSSNDCNTNTLQFNCTCSANNSQPGLQYYTETMPTFICEQIFQNCIVAGENDAAAQKLCNQNEKQNCGHLNPANFTPSSSSSAAPSSTPAATQSSSPASGSGAGAASTTPSGTSTPSPSTSHNAAASLAIGGTSLFGLMAAAFGFLL
ncbi:hypothetical protein F5884DRAFT_366481 [Xylogone sp. PMI_703]|nr:hypothetical protein F5884DRAFT_366481 [Xylogone sp. PMI_703]